MRSELLIVLRHGYFPPLSTADVMFGSAAV